MKIIYKNEVIFKLLYFLLIAVTGAFISAYSPDMTIILISILAPFVYIALAMKKEIRRFRVVRKEFPRDWIHIVRKYSKFYNFLDDTGKKQFEKDIAIFLSEHNVRGIKGEEVDLWIKVLVAVGVATIMHGRQDWEPPFSDGVVVYPGKTFDPEYNLHKGQIAGQAGERRPLLVTKEILEKSFRDPEDGYNSLIHEIAHYFDFENPFSSGLPVIGGDKKRILEWVSVMENEREKVNRGESFLCAYAGTNEAEFFAVATEYFFERPDVMVNENPELYELLKDFYNIDMQKIFKKS